MKIIRILRLTLIPREILDGYMEHLRSKKEENPSLVQAARIIAHWQQEARMGYGAALDHALAHRIHCEQPEVDLRQDLDAEIRSLQDHLARIEEVAI